MQCVNVTVHEFDKIVPPHNKLFVIEIDTAQLQVLVPDDSPSAMCVTGATLDEYLQDGVKLLV